MSITAESRPYSDIPQQRIAHLEMIQSVITRLSNEGFLVKGWAITVTGAFLGFAITSESWALSLASVIPTTAFWYLDGTFLRAERLFRAMHSHVQRSTGQVQPFDMAATAPGFVAVAAVDPGGGIDSLQMALRRPAISVLYGSLICAAIAIAAILALTSNTDTGALPVKLV